MTIWDSLLGIGIVAFVFLTIYANMRKKTLKEIFVEFRDLIKSSKERMGEKTKEEFAYTGFGEFGDFKRKKW